MTLEQICKDTGSGGAGSGGGATIANGLAWEVMALSFSCIRYNLTFCFRAKSASKGWELGTARREVQSCVHAERLMSEYYLRTYSHQVCNKASSRERLAANMAPKRRCRI